MILKIIGKLFDIVDYIKGVCINYVRVDINSYPEDYLPRISDDKIEKIELFDVTDVENNLAPINTLFEPTNGNEKGRYVYNLDIEYHRLYWMLGSIWGINMVSENVLSTGCGGIKIFDKEFYHWIPKNYRNTNKVVSGLYRLFNHKPLIDRKPVDVTEERWNEILDDIFEYLSLLEDAYGQLLHEKYTLSQIIKDKKVLKKWQKEYNIQRLRAKKGRDYLIQYWGSFTK